MIDFEVQDKKNAAPMVSIKVIGVGGAGGNTINSIMSSCSESIDFVVANTDAQALELTHAEKKIRLGVKSTRGLGTGADPEQGKRAAEEDLDKVLESVEGADIVFLTAGMGGGTGSGALPVIARALRDKGILTIAIVTKPFIFEGKKRDCIAQQAIEKLRTDVDILIVIPNQKLLDVVDHHVSMIDAFSMINDVLGQSVKAISDIITKAGHINVDFADVRSIIKGQGLAVMGTARASGSNRAHEAALKAISSPLLENMSIKGASRVLLNITGGPDLSLYEVSQAAQIIYDQVDEQAQIILGSVIDPHMTDEVCVTIIATGFTYSVQKTEEIVEVSSAQKGSETEHINEQSTQQVVQKQEATGACCDHITLKPALQEQNVHRSPVLEPQEDAVEWLNAHAREEDHGGSSIVNHELPADIDMDDLDIPSFMRVSEVEKQ